MSKDYFYQFRGDEETEAALQEIEYYIRTSQPPGMPLPTKSDVHRYATLRAAASIRNERAKAEQA